MGKSRLCLALVAALLLIAVRARRCRGAGDRRGRVDIALVRRVGEPARPRTARARRRSTPSAGRFAAEARAAGVATGERFAYSTLFNGVSVSARDEAVAEIRASTASRPSIPSTR